MYKRITKSVVCIAIFIFILFPTISFAVGTGHVSTENIFIPEGSYSSKASPIRFVFDPGTEFNVGDTMEFALTSYATLAVDIDLIVGDGSDVGVGSVFNSLTFCDSATGDGPLILPDQSTIDSPLVTAGNVIVETTFGGVCFRFTGSAGSDSLLMTVLGTPSVAGTEGSLVSIFGSGAAQSQGTLKVEVEPGEDGALILSVFDLETYDNAGLKSIWLKPLTGAVSGAANLGYTVKIPAERVNENALCIDVSAINPTNGSLYAQNGDNIYMNVDAGGEYIFSNAPFGVAYIINSEEVTRYVSDVNETGYFSISGTDCNPLDNDAGLYNTFAKFSDGFCPDTHRANKLMIKKPNSFYPFNTYRLRLAIRVNGESGNRGVYWGAPGGIVPHVATASTTYSNRTNLENAPSTALTGVSGQFKAYIGFDFIEVTSITDTNTWTGCAVDLAARATVLQSDYAQISLTTPGDDLIWFAVPKLVFDSSMLIDGDVVSLSINLFEAPCGIIFNQEIVIGTATTAPICVSETKPNLAPILMLLLE